MEKEFDVTEDSVLLLEGVDFSYVPKDKVEQKVHLEKFVREEDKETFRRFAAQAKLGDVFYTWAYNPGPLSGCGGICIFRNSRPVMAYSTWIS